MLKAVLTLVHLLGSDQLWLELGANLPVNHLRSTSTAMQPRILLLQARNADDAARHEERTSFARAAGVPEEHVIPFDLLNETLTLATVRRYDVLMAGGSGDYYVSKGNLPNSQAVLEVLAEVVALGRPTFASCFGFQLIVKALGGEITYAPAHTEVGTFPVTLTETGRSDALFGALPNTFLAQLGRKDRATRLPDSLLHLAGSEKRSLPGLARAGSAHLGHAVPPGAHEGRKPGALPALYEWLRHDDVG